MLLMRHPPGRRTLPTICAAASTGGRVVGWVVVMAARHGARLQRPAPDSVPDELRLWAGNPRHRRRVWRMGPPKAWSADLDDGGGRRQVRERAGPNAACAARSRAARPAPRRRSRRCHSDRRGATMSGRRETGERRTGTTGMQGHGRGECWPGRRRLRGRPEAA